MPQPKVTSRAVHEDEPESGRSRDAKPLAVTDPLVRPMPKQPEMKVPDDDTLERLGKANARLIKDHSDRLILAVVEKGETQLWWVRPTKLELLNPDERKAFKSMR